MTRPLAAALSLAAALLSALAAPAPATAQSADPSRAASLDAAFKRGAANPAYPKTLAAEVRCAAAWPGLSYVYEETGLRPPSDLEPEDFWYQEKRWTEVFAAKDEAARKALAEARQNDIGAMIHNGKWEDLAQLVGACGFLK